MTALVVSTRSAPARSASRAQNGAYRLPRTPIESVIATPRKPSRRSNSYVSGSNYARRGPSRG